MRITSIKLIYSVLISCFAGFLFGQQNPQELWKKSSVQEQLSKPKVRRNSEPITFDIYELNVPLLKSQLQGAPIRGQFTGISPVFISFPMPGGKLERFRVMESPIMHPDLAAKYPMIKTYAAQGVDDPTATMRFSLTQFGLHVMCLSGVHSTGFMDPYTTDLNSYIVYDKASLLSGSQDFECFTNEASALPSMKNKVSSTTSNNADDQKLRTFRLALSCTAEYGNIFAINIGTEKADIQAQMAITMNRVNGVFERDLAITMEFIPNNDLIIYYGSTSADPWGSEWNTTTAQTIDSTIGVANYDIGHNFNTTGGGNAGCLNCVCSSVNQGGDHKGRGFTGRSNPTGDAFDIDYVAHEMGHQFGGYHVMNTCSRSGSGMSEVEPASASSIMGYAGICPTNIQAHSDDDFNYVNVRDISANVQTGNSTCAQITTLTNQPPTANAGNDYTIPKSTAFILEGSATDPDGLTSLTYNWSQNDPAQSPGNGAPLPTYAIGPLYRSISPTISPNRYMPNIASVIAGNLTPTWEVTPSVARVMNFSFLVRDNDVNGGQTASDLMMVTVNGTAGPFVVTSQGIPTTWYAGSNATVTWNVAGTTASPVSTPLVDIYFSMDGGYTYPITIATGLPNNGSAAVAIPTVATTQGRVMVRGAGNIFYDINNANITVQPAQFLMNYTSSNASVCPPNSAVYQFVYSTFSSFSENTIFSASGLPAGASAVFSPSVASVNGTAVTMTVTGITPAMAGNYTVLTVGTATSATQTNSLNLTILSPSLTPVALSVPVDQATGVSPSVNLTWVSAGAGVVYDIDIANDAAFTTMIEHVTGITTNSYTPVVLQNGATYYWRIKASSACATANYSNAFQFVTSSCSAMTSASVPIGISASSISTVVSTLTVTTFGNMTDVNVVGLMGFHSNVSDLKISLKNPAGISATLFDGICSSDHNFNLNFDDAASPGAIACPPTTGGNFQSQNALSIFNGSAASGVWTLTVEDRNSTDGGALTGWGLNFCTDLVTGINSVSVNHTLAMYPNPTSGLLTIQVNSPKEEALTYKVTNTLGQLFDTKSISSNKEYQLDLSGKSAGVYYITIQGETLFKTEKIILQK